MQEHPRRPQFPLRTGDNPHITSAVGLEETAGRLRARQSSLFPQTVIWITGLICLAFLLGSLAQAWSNSQLMQHVQAVQQQTQQLRAYHNQLAQQANHFKDPFVIESEAREQLGYVRPGEHSVVIVGASDSKQQSPSQPAGSSTQQGFWQAWWNIFFGK